VRSATLTIVVSRIDMIIPRITTPAIFHTYGSMRSDAAGPCSEPDAAGALDADVVSVGDISLEVIRYLKFRYRSLCPSRGWTNVCLGRLSNVGAVGLLPDYSKQAHAYDTTRAASPSVLAPLRQALAGAPGPALLDVGGGTGNYAAALAEDGWQPLVLDRSPEMLAHAAAKGLQTVHAEATDLRSVDRI
jgi:hypothetical protein